MQEEILENNWSVYILQCSDSSYYCGITNNLEKRIEKHNSGKGAKYTRARLPVVLVTFKSSLTKSEALKLEIEVKKKKRKDKIDFLKNYMCFS